MVCEQPNPQEPCAADPPDLFAADFIVAVSDAEGDLQNPIFGLGLGGQPSQDIPLAGDLGDGSTTGAILQVCSGWPRGQLLPFEVTVTDAAGNTSAAYSGSWSVPASPGTGDCP
ncbi:MAG TPA: hypothetical protein DIU15_05675 [Deltaproteobacteria bacterium]|nr:hypothetical protein [Deltaproteobacteria bacterium]